ncbi:MAG: elongation factor P [Spirochaetes bacterium GWF1_51_8]|nr:MAG: elongation factor P [Spirochaetes bacterium GWF1_51_8]
MFYTEIRKGNVLKIEGELYLVLWAQNHKPGKGGAVMRTRLKNIIRGTVMEKTFRGGDTFEEAYVEKRQAQLLYKEADGSYVFMDNETFDQNHIPADTIGEDAKYLKEEMICTLHMYEGDVILVEPPMFVELEIIETDPGARGDTVSGGTKPATLETGAVVLIPLFVQKGEKVKVDTRDDRYIERVK